MCNVLVKNLSFDPFLSNYIIKGNHLQNFSELYQNVEDIAMAYHSARI